MQGQRRARRRTSAQPRQRVHGHSALVRRPDRRFEIRGLRSTAQARLKKFRQGSALAVALTGLLLLILGGAPAPAQEVPEPASPTNEAVIIEPEDPSAALEQATTTLRDLAATAYGMFPKILIALAVLATAALLAKLTRALLTSILGKWARTDAIIALSKIAIFLLAIAIGLAIIAGDVRALLGSIGLIGLALSWALQTPIESFTGWLLNSFRGYYRVGDRIEVGEVFGDVYKIDILTTTVWETGGPGKPVAGAQATGTLITFPNWEVLRSNILNYSRDFPYVWDEITLTVANESDLAYTMHIFEKTAASVLGDMMAQPAEQYHRILQEARLAFEVDPEPGVYLSPGEAWTNCTIRYVVPVRARRKWSTKLLLAIGAESSKPEHKGKIITGYPRTEVRLRETWTPD